MNAKLVPLKGSDLFDYVEGRPVFDKNENRFTLVEDYDEDCGEFFQVFHLENEVGNIISEDYEYYPDKDVYCETDYKHNFLLYIQEPTWETAFIKGSADYIENSETGYDMVIPHWVERYGLEKDYLAGYNLKGRDNDKIH